MPRDVITIDDLSVNEILALFKLADEFSSVDGACEKRPCRPKPRSDAKDYVIATLFYEPSTRTRLSFESAMLRLGGHVIGFADPKATSAAKGETIADTVRVVENYADLIVIRHPREGAAKLAAHYAHVPVINAGDGGHEHPTQTLCDLYTLQREKKELQHLNVLLLGDLKNGRTIHSLVYGLARFGARIMPLPASGLELPAHVQRRLQTEYGYITVDGKDFVERMQIGFEGPVANELGKPAPQIDVVYVTPSGPNQPALIPSLTVDMQVKVWNEARSRIDACYVTRLQLERMQSNGERKSYPVVDAKFLEAERFRNTKVLHPLPRVNELGYDLDNDPRGAYFKQAAYGVPVRMALIAAVLGLREPLSRTAPSKNLDEYTRGDVGCSNPMCITNDDSEKKSAPARFWIIARPSTALRCWYCENEIEVKYIGDMSTNKYREANAKTLASVGQKRLIMFTDEQEARTRGFEPYRTGVRSLSH